MALGKVQVNNLNLGQGDIAAIERHFLFIGLAGAVGEESQLFSVNAQTDLEDALADSGLQFIHWQTVKTYLKRLIVPTKCKVLKR